VFSMDNANGFGASILSTVAALISSRHFWPA
jgi:hypothetical protein